MMKYMKTPDYNLLDLVVTASEMAEIDRLAIENVGIPGDVLMENAGGKVAEVIVNHANILPDAHVVILCGKGNNGGDGYVVARYLLDKGAQVTAISTNVCADLKGSAALNCEILHKLGVSVLRLDVREHVSLLQQAQLVVDALL
ncbi:NAD(P)H-hydrate epimerase, partial [candidate division KSB1 bacterium]|nr:NAD(P)H-hydrate epimerase [candidate division KSB1 bacterium]